MVKKEREIHVQKDKEETKKPRVDPVPSKFKPKETKSAPTMVAKSAKASPSGKAILKQKEKPERTYGVVSLINSETKS